MKLLFYIPDWEQFDYFTTLSGYVYLWNTGCLFENKRRYVKRCRYLLWVMGIAVPEGYVIHHRNGVKSDDRPENLEVMPRSEHMSLHQTERFKDKKYADNFSDQISKRWDEGNYELQPKIMKELWANPEYAKTTAEAISRGWNPNRTVGHCSICGKAGVRSDSHAYHTDNPAERRKHDKRSTQEKFQAILLGLNSKP